MTRETIALIGVGVLVFTLIVFFGRTTPSLNADARMLLVPVNDPRSQCVAFANEIVAKNPQTGWERAFDNCAANHLGVNGDRPNMGPKAVRTESSLAPIGVRPVPHAGDLP
jgi:hypothetical protein